MPSAKYTAKWGAHIAGMILQTHSNDYGPQYYLRISLHPKSAFKIYNTY